MLAISVLGWILRVAVGLIVVVFAYTVIASMLAKFKIAPDQEVDPEAVVPVNLRYRCIVCGAEVTMTAAQEGEEPDAPRHCREDMVLMSLGP
ncbi:MAG: hypothetical protein FJW86_13465 [Actinobacteria bacterium]|nr:hypothetical protein [Actinomycetota bacterium]